jgi:cellulose synthase operon protein C
MLMDARRRFRSVGLACLCLAGVISGTLESGALAQQRGGNTNPARGQSAANQQNAAQAAAQTQGRQAGAAQQGRGPQGQAPTSPRDPKQNRGDANASDPKAVNYYADAANFQNNAAFALAIEEWQKLLKEFPRDPLANRARHYLGVCYMQLETPDYAKAAEAFTQSLGDKKLEEREETLVYLGWCQLMMAREASAEGPQQRMALEQARMTLTEFLKSYPQGNHLDQALFYLGEIEFALGRPERAVEHYDQLLKSKSLTRSSLRADALYALGVAYEQMQDAAQAQTAYSSFLQQFPQHRLVYEVRLRMAELLLRSGKAAEAERRFAELAATPDNPLADYAMLRQAKALGEQQRQSEAAGVYSELARRFPKSKYAAEAKLAAGQMLFGSGQWDDAAAAFRQAIGGKDPASAEAVHWLALTLLRKGAAAEAVQLLQQALSWAESTPSGPVLKLDLADALYDLPERLDDAWQAYVQVATDHPDDPVAPRAAYNAAFVALQMSRLDDARRWSETFLKKYPQDPLRTDVAYIASETLLQQGQHAAAIEAYKQLLSGESANPEAPMWTMRLAMAHYLTNQYQAAIELLTGAMSKFVQPRQQAEARFILGACYLASERLEEAIAELSASTQTGAAWPQADEVYLSLAQAYQRSGDAAAAERALAEMLQRYPQSRMRFQARFRLGQIQVAQQKYPAAIAAYRSLLDEPLAASLHEYAQYGIAYCALQQEQWEEALTALGPLMPPGRTDGLAGDARLAAGLALRKLGRLDQAIELLQAFLNTKPVGNTLANALYELGMAQIEKEQYDAAIATFASLEAEVPDYGARDKVLFELGWVWVEKQDPQRALEMFTRVVRETPESELAVEALYEIGQLRYQAQSYDTAAEAYAEVTQRAQDAELREKAVYKLGWSFFQRERYGEALEQFRRQARDFPNGRLALDALFMMAESMFKQDKFAEALPVYERARQMLEKQGLQARGETLGGDAQPDAAAEAAANEQVRTLIYLHGAQCYREQKKWGEAEAWLREIIQRYPNTAYLDVVIYELAQAKEKQNQPEEALKLYAEVATKFRNETAARSRFMMGELHFAQRQLDKAVVEFQRVMYGYGAEKASDAVKNWQARAGFEAGRCSEGLMADLQGDLKTKARAAAKEFYQYVIDKHPAHEVVKQAQVRLEELKK